MAVDTKPVAKPQAKRERKPMTAEDKAKREAMKIAKFRELGEARVTNALKRISQVGNLSNRQSYTFTDEQANKIVKALRDAVETVVNQFKGNDKGVSLFTL